MSGSERMARFQSVVAAIAKGLAGRVRIMRIRKRRSQFETDSWSVPLAHDDMFRLLKILEIVICTKSLGVGQEKHGMERP